MNQEQRHVGAETPASTRWDVRVTQVHPELVEEHLYWDTVVQLTPPPGETPDEVVLVDDAITHEVRSHSIVLVAARGAEEKAEPEALGGDAVPAEPASLSSAAPVVVGPSARPALAVDGPRGRRRRAAPRATRASQCEQASVGQPSCTVSFPAMLWL